MNDTGSWLRWRCLLSASWRRSGFVALASTQRVGPKVAHACERCSISYTYTHTPLPISEQITPLAETCFSYLVQGFVTIRFEMLVSR